MLNFKKALLFITTFSFLLNACTSSPLRRPDSVPDAPNELAEFIRKSGAKTKIVKPAAGFLKYEYIVPSGPYDQLFDWDMYFMGVALSYDKIGAPVQNSVKNFLSFVDEYANYPGYSPREISKDGPWALPQQCKPFMAQAAVRASQTLHSYAWLNEVGKDSASGKTFYEKLKLMLGFWEANRKGSNGLFIWDNGLESGADNNPAVSTDPALTTEGVDLQVYLYREYLAVAALAVELGHPSDATAMTKKANVLRDAMVKYMWSPQDELFYNINSRTGKKIRIKTWISFTPLWAKMVPQALAKKMIDRHLLSTKEFWAPFGVRTLSMTEKLYEPKAGYWKGPVWVISNYLIMHGLLNYGYQKEAVELAEKTVAMLVADYKDSGGMNECYHPETGETRAGGNFLSWNLLAEHMLEEAHSGYDPSSW